MKSDFWGGDLLHTAGTLRTGCCSVPPETWFFTVGERASDDAVESRSATGRSSAECAGGAVTIPEPE